MTSEQTRVVLIKPGDTLVIGGVTVPDAETADRWVAALRDMGFRCAITDQDASIAVAEHGGELDRMRENLRQLRAMVSHKLGFNVEMPVPALVELLIDAEIRRPNAGGDA